MKTEKNMENCLDNNNVAKCHYCEPNNKVCSIKDFEPIKNTIIIENCSDEVLSDWNHLLNIAHRENGERLLPDELLTMLFHIFKCYSQNKRDDNVSVHYKE